MAASGTGKSAGQRALTQRRRNRTLPAIEVPRVEDQDLTRALGNIAEHLRIYEGDVAAPKERFITLQELEDTGLIESKTKGGYAYISRILSKDVAQKSGSTANPTLKGTVRKDTALGPRTAGGGGGGSQNPIEQGKRGLIQKLSDIENVVVQSPAQADFLYYDGGKWKNFSLFKRNNKWTGRNTFVNTTTFSGGIDTATLAIDGVDIDTYIPTVTDDLYVDVTGDTMTGILGLTYSATAGARNSTMVLYSGNPQLSIEDTGAAADEGVWNIIGGLTSLKIRALSDDYATAVDVMTFNRGTGATIADVTFDVEVTGVQAAFDGAFNASGSGITLIKSGGYAAMGSHYSSERTWLGNNVYVDGADAVSNQARYAKTHPTYGHTIYEMAAGKHYWYGAGASVTQGDVVTKSSLGSWDTNGLVIDQLGSTTGITADTISLSGYGLLGNRTNAVYLTNEGSGGVQINAGGAHGATYKVATFNTTQVAVTPPSATAGTPALYVLNSGTANKIARFVGDSDSLDIETVSAGDYKIRNFGQDNSIVFYDGTGGVDINYNGSLRIECDSGNDVALYYSGTEEFHTQDSNAAGNTTGAQVKNFNGTFYDVGMNVMPRFRTNVSFTLTDQDCGGYMYHSNSTTYTITLNNSGGGGADFPIGGTFFILNYGTGNVTVNTGSGTLYSPQLGTSTTGSRTIGGNSVATILKYGADSWFVWGDAIS